MKFQPSFDNDLIQRIEDLFKARDAAKEVHASEVLRVIEVKLSYMRRRLTYRMREAMSPLFFRITHSDKVWRYPSGIVISCTLCNLPCVQGALWVSHARRTEYNKGLSYACQRCMKPNKK